MSYPAGTCPKCGSKIGHPGPCPKCHSHAGAAVGVAIEIAMDVHRGQFRKGGMQPPYIIHPIAVLNRMLRWGIVETSLLTAAPLHDAVEDGDDPAAILKRIQEFCGQPVADYVSEMTCGPDEDKKAYLESFHTKSVGSLFMKLADRLCNVDDFFHDKSTQKYAGKYFRKADPIFKAFLERESECSEKYGHEVWEAANYELLHTAILFGCRHEIVSLCEWTNT